MFFKKNNPPKEKETPRWMLVFIRIGLAQKIFFIDHLRTMVKAGLSLVESLDIMQKQMSNAKLKMITTEIRQGIEQGKSFHEVLSAYPKVFPPMYVTMIAAGETAGKMEESLEQVVSQMKKAHQLLSTIRGAMVYPAVILCAMIGVGVMMTTVILPKLLVIFKDFDAELPLATRILIAIVDFMSNPVNFGLLSLFVVSLLVGYIYLLRHNTSFRRMIHTLMLHTPILGKIVKDINLAKFSLTLSSLLKSTIPIIDAVEISSQTCGNLRYREALSHASQQIKTGIPLSEVLRGYPKLFPPMVTEMIMVGERSGQVEHLLQELTEYYSDTVDKTMKNFSTIIEPVIILMLGIAVAGMAVAVIMPMYSLVQNF